MKHVFTAIFFIGFLVGVTAPAQAQPASVSVPPFGSPMPPAPPETGRGINAIHDATAAGKLLFVFFHEATASQPNELQTKGAVTKADLQAALQKATSSGGGSCGTGGCGPSGCGNGRIPEKR